MSAQELTVICANIKLCWNQASRFGLHWKWSVSSAKLLITKTNKIKTKLKLTKPLMKRTKTKLKFKAKFKTILKLN